MLITLFTKYCNCSISAFVSNLKFSLGNLSSPEGNELNYNGGSGWLVLLFFATTANPLCICWNTWFYVKFQVIYDYIQCKKFSRTWKLTISQFNCSLKGESKKHRLQLSFIKILTRSGVTMTIVKAILWLIVNFWQKCKRFRLKYKRQNVDLLLEVTLETSEDIGHIWILILSIFFSLNFWIFSIVSEIYLEI